MLVIAVPAAEQRPAKAEGIIEKKKQDKKRWLKNNRSLNLTTTKASHLGTGKSMTKPTLKNGKQIEVHAK